MTNDELKKKIVKILANCKCEECAVEYCADCEGNPCIENCREKQQADALIAAGIGDVETVQKIAASATAMAVLEAAKAEHRAEVAERAVYNLAYGEWQREGARRAICEKYAPSTARDYLDRAEKELAEEEKE